MRPSGSGQRLNSVDTLRGLTLLSMMAYHAAYDCVWIFGAHWEWYLSPGAYLWQQSICWTFILLSGYCRPLSRRPLRRGLMVLGGGILVSAATILVMPENAVRFGVLTFLGSASLLSIPLEPLLRRIPPRVGVGASFLLFMVLRDVNRGFLGFEGASLLALSPAYYANGFSAFWGFPPADFFSTDYFSFLPWFFLFLTGYFLFRLRPEEAGTGIRLPLFTAMGRRSLLLYLLHQPVIYGVLFIFYHL